MLCSSGICTRGICTTASLMKMPAPKKAKDGPKQVKKAPPPPKLTMLQVREKYLEELPPLPYLAYSDERCFIEEYKRPLPNVTEEEAGRRGELLKQYAGFMSRYWKEVRINHKKQVYLRVRALEHLQSADAALYSAAITFNFDMFPATASGLRETPPNKHHVAPLKVEEKILDKEEAIATSFWEELEKAKQGQRPLSKKARAKASTAVSPASAVKL